VPAAVSGTQSFQSIGSGDAFTCGLNTTGKVYCWGNLVGGGSLVPLLNDAPAFTSLTVGGGHACALTSDGTAYCWGANATGEVGDSTTANRAAPTRVVTTKKFALLTAGFAHTCGITVEGAVACWGLNRNGELGDF